ESLGKQKTSWQIVTIIFFLALLSIAELKYASETSTWWLRAWGEAGPVLVWITVALTIYSGLSYTWQNRDLFAPNQYRVMWCRALYCVAVSHAIKASSVRRVLSVTSSTTCASSTNPRNGVLSGIKSNGSTR